MIRATINQWLASGLGGTDIENNSNVEKTRAREGGSGVPIRAWAVLYRRGIQGRQSGISWRGGPEEIVWAAGNHEINSRESTSERGPFQGSNQTVAQ